MLRSIALTVVGGLLAAWGCTSLAGIDDFQVGGGTTAGGSGGTGGSLTGGGGTGGADECDAPADCPGEDLTCQWRTCDDHVCGTGYAEPNTACTEGGEVCSAEGDCLWSAGHGCATGEECLSGHCRDGVCCATTCDGFCEACAQAKTGAADGSCAPIRALEDPDDECTNPPGLGCDGNGLCATCGATAPGGSGACPSPPCDSCDADTCLILGDVDDEYLSQTVDCPAGWNCHLLCQADRACNLTTVNCPASQSCLVECTDSQHKCEDLVLNCSPQAPCLMQCGGGDTCRNATVNCGSNDCEATCIGGDAPAVVGCPNDCTCATCS